MQFNKRSIEKLIATVQKNIESLNDGKIKVLSNEENSFRIFNPENQKWSYVKKKDNQVLRAIAQRHYEEKVLRESKKQLAYLSKAEKVNERYLIDIINKIKPARRKLIKPYELADDDYVKQWLSKKYESNPFQEEKRYTTQNGEKVRSKSEVIIADRLKSKNIPYKYECPLTLGNKTLYPDFTILNIKTREEVILEHFGLMDNMGYYESSFVKKYDLYMDSGLEVGKKFFFTVETEAHPLSLVTLDRIIGSILVGK